MIYIKQHLSHNGSVTIYIDGILDEESFSILKDVIKRHFLEEKMIFLDLGGLLHITREGRALLKEFEDRVVFVDPDRHLDHFRH